MHLELYFDGACEPTNPGGTGSFGWVIVDALTGKAIDSGDGSIRPGPAVTNNVAEYFALGHGLKRLCDDTPEGLTVLTVKGDSKLAVHQVGGSWACNKDHLRKLRDRCRELLGVLRGKGIEIELLWVPREQNEEADALSQQGWEKATGKPFPVRVRHT
jgi:ribonuclease HI